MAAQLNRRGVAVALLLCALAGAAATPRASAAAAPRWPTVEAGGRPSLSALQARLGDFSGDWLGVVRLQRQACDSARNQGKVCPQPVFAALAQVQAVALGWQDVAATLSARLAASDVPAATRDACSQRRDMAACEQVRREAAVLDAFAALRIAPALERLSGLAAAAWKDLQFARAVQQAAEAKMPQPDQPSPPPAPPPIEVGPDPKMPLPPPPPPPQLTQACRSGKTAACMEAGAICEARKSFSEARGWYKLACRQGNRAACVKAK